MIYYLHPYTDIKIPIGGILKIIDHVMLFKENGIPAALVYFTDQMFEKKTLLNEKPVNISLPWAHTEFQSRPMIQLMTQLKSEDIIVIPEIRPRLIEFFPTDKGKKVCFVQNWHKIVPKKYGLNRHETYKSLGYHSVLTCGDFLTDYVQGKVKDYHGGNHSAGEIPIYTINNSINHSIFFRDKNKRKQNRVIMLARKGKKYIQKIMIKAKSLPYTFYVVEQSISQKELAEEFKKSDIYIHTGFPEGLPLPPLEAQACGCLVIGFTGGGGRENMIQEKTSLVSRDGDVNDVVRNLKLLLNDEPLKEKLREAGYQNSLTHNRENEKQKLLNAFNTINRN